MATSIIQAVFLTPAARAMPIPMKITQEIKAYLYDPV
jgi:hypothetical protein